MTWVKLDDGFFRNSKARAAGKDGRALYLAGLCYCAGSLTDGAIPRRDLAIIAAEADVRATVVARLVDADLWQPTDDGWFVPDFLEHNPSADKVKREREEGKRRAAASAERAAKLRAKNGRRNGEASGDPSPSPLGVTSSSNPRLLGPDGVEEEDSATAEKLRQLWPMVARRRAREYRREGGKIRDEQGFLREDARRQEAEHGARARSLLAGNPGLSVEALADLLDRPQPVPSVRSGLQPAEFGTPSGCELCGGMGMVETDEGAERCSCRTTNAAAAQVR